MRSLRPGVGRSRSVNLIEDLGVRAALFIPRPVLSHYMSNRSEIDAGAKSLFDAVAQGVVASNVVKTFPLREAAAAHKFIGGRKTTGSIVMLPFEEAVPIEVGLWASSPSLHSKEHHVDHTPRN